MKIVHGNHESQHSVKLPVMCWVEFEKQKPVVSYWCLIANEGGLTVAWWDNESQMFENVDNPFMNPPVWWFPIQMPPCI